MMKHYSEADLLETYYMQPGESMPVMLHLAGCSDCAARYERLERKLREAATCQHHREKPESFWSRQRRTIMLSISSYRERRISAARTWRTVAAAVLSFFLGGAVMYEAVKPQPPAPHPVTTTRQAARESAPADDPQLKPGSDDLLTHDAWQSDELRQFHGVVEWESWTPDKAQAKKEGSL